MRNCASVDGSAGRAGRSVAAHQSRNSAHVDEPDRSRPAGPSAPQLLTVRVHRPSLVTALPIRVRSRGRRSRPCRGGVPGLTHDGVGVGPVAEGLGDEPCTQRVPTQLGDRVIVVAGVGGAAPDRRVHRSARQCRRREVAVLADGPEQWRSPACGGQRTSAHVHLERDCAAEQPDDGHPPTRIERGHHLQPPDPRAHRARAVLVGERQRLHRPDAVLVRLRAADPHMGAIEAVTANVPAFEVDEFAAPERPGVAHHQQRGVAALQHFRRPPR